MTITPEELESLEPQKTRTIDIEDFVDLEQIDPIYYDHPYYLAPDKGAAKAYKLLLDAMEEADKVAIARVVIRSKENLVAIRPRDGAITMETMLFSDEVVPPDSFDELSGGDGNVKTTKREVDMAQQLIDSLSGDFDPSKYRDEYRERVLEMIERKAQGEKITIEAPAEEPKEVPDLMAALEASIAGAEEPAEEAGARRRTARARARRRRRPRRRSRCRRASPSTSRAARLSLSNLDKVMYPEVGFTKGQVIDYYTRVAPAAAAAPARPPADAQALPERRRGRALLREAVPLAPARVGAPRAVEVSSKTIDFCLCDDLPTLVWLANLADLELHPSLSKVAEVERPTMMAFDLDPGRRPGSPSAARWRCSCARRSAGSGSSASRRPPGSKGIQVYVPLNGRRRLRHGTKPLSQRARAAPRGRSTRS